MPQEHEFAVTWTYRDPMVTVEYAKGWRGPLPADRLKAAKGADVLVKDEPVAEPTEAKPKRTRRKAE